MVSPVKDAEWMEWITRLMGAFSEGTSDVRELPSSSFSCLLDEQPTHLVPRRLLANYKNGRFGELIVNPRCFFSSGHDLPGELAGCADMLEDFSLDGNIVWVPDTATGGLAPFWLGTQFTAFLAGLEPGDREPTDFPDYARRILASAGVLVKPDAGSRRRKQWSEQLLRLREQFRRKFVPIGGLIHPFHVGALRRYYRCLIRKGRIHLGDDQSPRRYGAHNESVAGFFHHQLTGAVSDIVGEPVKPSYVYTCSYLSGSDLEKHTDRDQCEFTITFCLDFSPEPAVHTPWPVHMDANDSRITIYQALGDALLFCGRELPHYRHPLTKGHTSTSIFFHYVRQGFTGSLR